MEFTWSLVHSSVYIDAFPKCWIYILYNTGDYVRTSDDRTEAERFKLLPIWAWNARPFPLKFFFNGFAITQFINAEWKQYGQLYKITIIWKTQLNLWHNNALFVSYFRLFTWCLETLKIHRVVRYANSLILYFYILFKLHSRNKH